MLLVRMHWLVNEYSERLTKFTSVAFWTSLWWDDIIAELFTLYRQHPKQKNTEGNESNSNTYYGLRWVELE